MSHVSSGPAEAYRTLPRRGPDIRCPGTMAPRVPIQGPKQDKESEIA